MACVIKILGLVSGEPCPFDNFYVAEYDPTYVHPEGYDGGILEVCKQREDALQFPDAAAAFKCRNLAYGLRADGLPNRPLSAFTVEIS